MTKALQWWLDHYTTKKFDIPAESIPDRYAFELKTSSAWLQLPPNRNKRIEGKLTGIVNDILSTEDILIKAFKENRLPIRIGNVIYEKPGRFLSFRIRWALWRKKKREG